MNQNRRVTVKVDDLVKRPGATSAVRTFDP